MLVCLLDIKQKYLENIYKIEKQKCSHSFQQQLVNLDVNLQHLSDNHERLSAVKWEEEVNKGNYFKDPNNNQRIGVCSKLLA